MCASGHKLDSRYFHCVCALSIVGDDCDAGRMSCSHLSQPILSMLISLFQRDRNIHVFLLSTIRTPDGHRDINGASQNIH